MTKLLPATVAALREYRVPQPTFANMVNGELFDFKTRRGRFKVLLRVDRKFVAFDPAADLGKGQRGVYATEDEAIARVEALSADADAAGEDNAIDRHGLQWNWGDAKTWLK